jgi:hypothetical protein
LWVRLAMLGAVSVRAINARNDTSVHVKVSER